MLNNVSSVTDLRVIVEPHLNFESNFDQIRVKARESAACSNHVNTNMFWIT